MTYDVIIVGAGIMGAAVAEALARRGTRVLVIDALPLKNRKNASNDVSRAFRIFHGSDVVKTELAKRACNGWEKLARKYPNRDIFRKTDMLLLDPSEFEMPVFPGDISQLGAHGLHLRFPQFKAAFGILDHAGAILNATAATRATAKAAKSVGAAFMHGTMVRSVAPGSVLLEDGRRIDCGQVVIACGSWSDRLLGGRIGLRATRQDVAFFLPKWRIHFDYGRFPVFMHLPSRFYGFPDHGVGAVKIARHVQGPEMDPDEPSREADSAFIEACRVFFAETVPGLADAELLRSRTCRYAVRKEGDFLIDRLDDRTVVATAFQGEGFKFAPAIGAIVADMTLGTRPLEIPDRFRL